MNSLSLARADLAQIAAAAVPAPGALIRLDAFAIIDAQGADALPFLHNLLTNDVEHLDASAAQQGGLCSPKGRLLATFLYWRTRDGVRLMLSADLAEPILRRLKMFVLRSKVSLADATESVALAGFVGPAAALSRPLSQLFDVLPDTARGLAQTPAGTLIRLPDASGLSRYLWCAPREAFETANAALDSALPRLESSVWDWLEICAGEPRITAATQDRFVPQMVNFELLGGVNFRKGCYPGQEVVARSQYRGTIKRRTLLARIALPAADAHALAAVRAGTDVFDSSAPHEPCGTIVNVARAPANGVDCLVELRLAALDSGGVLSVGTLDGPTLTLRVLPYAFPEDGSDEAAPAAGGKTPDA